MLDCFWATGKFHPTYFRADSLYFGYEYSGFYKGKRVMGITKSAGISLKVTPIEHLMWDIPEQWSLEDAATVPFAYAMVRSIYLEKYFFWKTIIPKSFLNYGNQYQLLCTVTNTAI